MSEREITGALPPDADEEMIGVTLSVGKSR